MVHCHRNPKWCTVTAIAFSVLGMKFRNQTDENFVDCLHKFSLPFEVINGDRFSAIYGELIANYGKVFDLRPVVAREIDGFQSAAYRTRGFSYFIAFYTMYREVIGNSVYVLTELHGQISKPDTIFKLPSSIGLAMSHAHYGGVDHVCFTPNLRFLTIRDQNDTIVGYGDAIPCLKEFRESYPEFVVA